MRREPGKILRKEFEAKLISRLPEFAPDKNAALLPGWRAWSWDINDDFRAFVVLVISNKDDSFTVEIAWSDKKDFPAPSIMLPGEGVESGAERFRLNFLIGRWAYWWHLVEQISVFDDVIFDLSAAEGPVEDAIQRIAPAVEEAVDQIKKYAVPYLVGVASWKQAKRSLISTPLKVEGVPAIKTLENGNKLVEWNLVSEIAVEETVLSGLCGVLAVNGLNVNYSQTGAHSFVVRYEFSPALPHETYWLTAVRNLLVIERTLGPLISIADLVRINWRLRFVVNERVGGWDIDKTPLMYAAEDMDHILVKQLLRGLSIDVINAKTPSGKTALHYATEKGDVAGIRVLLEAGADIDVPGELTPIQYASVQNLEILRMIAGGGKIDFPNKYGRTALMGAAGHGLLENVSWLLENGADRELADAFGETAIDWAKNNHHFHVVELLN